MAPPRKLRRPQRRTPGRPGAGPVRPAEAAAAGSEGADVWTRAGGAAERRAHPPGDGQALRERRERGGARVPGAGPVLGTRHHPWDARSSAAPPAREERGTRRPPLALTSSQDRARRKSYKLSIKDFFLFVTKYVSKNSNDALKG